MSHLTAALQLHFRKAAQAFPTLTAESTPLGFGGYGLVIDHHDGTVSKICFAATGADHATFGNTQCMNREIEALSLLHGHSFGSVHTPQLVEDPVILDDDEDYIGHYRMTKMEGQDVDWCHLLETDRPKTAQAYFQRMGKLVAAFHGFTSSLTYNAPLRHSTRDLPDHDDFLPETRALVTQANSYLQAHKKPAVIHGDLRPANIMSVPNGRITSLYDFSWFGPSDNHLLEFKWMMDYCPKAMPHIIDGYQQASGITIDAPTLYLTDFRRSMVYMTNSLNYATAENRDEKVAAINQKIQSALQPILHMTRPH